MGERITRAQYRLEERTLPLSVHIVIAVVVVVVIHQKLGRSRYHHVVTRTAFCLYVLLVTLSYSLFATRLGVFKKLFQCRTA